MKTDNIKNLNDVAENVEALYRAILRAVTKLMDDEVRSRNVACNGCWCEFYTDKDSNKITYNFHRGQFSYGGGVPISNIALKLMEDHVQIDTKFENNINENVFYQRVRNEILEQIELDVIRNFNIKNFRPM